jgi:hypothetical protein
MQKKAILKISPTKNEDSPIKNEDSPIKNESSSDEDDSLTSKIAKDITVKYSIKKEKEKIFTIEVTEDDLKFLLPKLQNKKEKEMARDEKYRNQHRQTKRSIRITPRFDVEILSSREVEYEVKVPTVTLRKIL